MTTQSYETLISKLSFTQESTNGKPTNENAEKLYDNHDFQNASYM